jgi:hypothetical protein
MQRTSTQAGGLRGACPLEEVTGETVNISEYLNFGFYDQLSFKENAGLGVTSIGRWLGVSHRVGGLISYWVLTMQGTVISRTTVQRVTNLEKETDEVKAAVIEFEGEISHRFKEEEDLAYDGAKPNPEDWSEYLQYDPDFQQEFDNIVNDPGILEADKDFTPDVVYGTYLNMELAIPRDSDGPKFALTFPPLLGVNITHYIVTYTSTIIYVVAVRTTFDGLQPLITTYRMVTKSTLSYWLIMVSFCFSCGTPCKTQKGLENHVKSRPKCLHDLGIARAESLGLSPSFPLAQLINRHSFRFKTNPNLASKRSVEVM